MGQSQAMGQEDTGMKPHRLDRLLFMIKIDWVNHRSDWALDRNQLGPMVEAYVSEMMEKTGLHGSVFDVSDRLLVQMIGNCVYFWQSAKHILGPLYELKEYSERKCGRDLWRGIHGHSDSFSNRGFEEHWDTLQGMCKRFVPTEDLIYQYEGVIDLDWTLEDWGT
jgi:hypothetical protein